MDVATLGFSSDTSGLDKANAALDGVATKADRAGTATARFRATMDAVSATAKVLDTAARNLSAASDKLAASMGGASNASNTLQSATQKVTVNFNSSVTAINKATAATNAQASADLKAADAKTKLATATSRVNVVMPGSSAAYTGRTTGNVFNNSPTGGSGSFASEASAASAVMAVTTVKQIGEEAEGAAGKLGKLADGVHVNSLAMREFVTIGRELSSGNLTRLPGSISLLAQSFGLLQYIITPVNIVLAGFTAGIVGYVVAVERATTANNEFANTLSLTGNYAGLTVDRYHAMAAAIGAATDTTTKSNEGLISSLAATNKFTADQISTLITSAQLQAKATGESADDILKSYEKMTEGPGKYADALLQNFTGVITPAQVAHIHLLEDTGNAQEALAELIKVQYAGILSTTQDATSGMARAWGNVTNAIGNAIHAAVQFGAQSKADSATTINSTRGGILGAFQSVDQFFGGTGKAFQPYIDQTNQNQATVDKFKKQQSDSAASTAAATAKIKEQADALAFLKSNYNSAYDSQTRFKNDVAALDKALANADPNDPRTKEARAHRSDIVEGLRQQDMPEAYKASIAKTPAVKHTAADRVDQTLTGDIATTQAQINALNLSADAALKAGNEQKYLNNATRDFKSISDAQRASIIAQADALTALQIQLRNTKADMDITAEATKSIDALKRQGDAIGLVGKALYYQNELQKEIDEHNQKTFNTPISAATMQTFQSSANQFANQSAANDNSKAYTSGTQALQEQIATLTSQKDALGLSTKAQNDAATAQSLLNDNVFKGLGYTPQQIKNYEALSGAAYDLTVQIANQKDAMDFLRSSVTGFVGDLQSGLKQGESFFTAFGKAVENVLDKVIDKLLTVALDAATGGSSGGIGGFLGSIGKALGIGGLNSTGGGWNAATSASIGGGAPTSMALSSISAPTFAFAKGGAFDSIVNTATPFRFGSGGANLGIMGEAGPEAVMPLTRGANGSLGVQMYGGQRGGGDVHYHAGDVNQTFPISGAVDVSAIQVAIQQSAERTKADIKKAMPANLQEYQMNGAISA